MSKEKCSFPMTYFKKNEALVTVGGWSVKGRLKEATIYNFKQNLWGELPSFPFEICLSSICILKNQWLYNFGEARN